MNIVEICKVKYPGQIEAGNINFRQPDDEILICEWNVEGIPRPLESDLLSELDKYQNDILTNNLQLSCQDHVQMLIEREAKSKQYDSSITCISYALSTNAKWKAEAMAFISWRDSLYDYVIKLVDNVKNGGDIPVIDKIIAGMPTMNWPL